MKHCESSVTGWGCQPSTECLLSTVDVSVPLGQMTRGPVSWSRSKRLELFGSSSSHRGTKYSILKSFLDSFLSLMLRRIRGLSCATWAVILSFCEKQEDKITGRADLTFTSEREVILSL